MPKDDVQLHKKSLNFFRTNNLWMDNEQIRKTRKQYAGFVLNAHPSMILINNLAITMNHDLRKTALGTETLAAQYKKLNGKNLITCHPGVIRRNGGVHIDGVII